jgi:phosphohistidine phosphatase
VTPSPDRPRALLVMRHCKSDWDAEGLDDFDRPLSSRGRKDARRVGRFLCAAGLAPDAIVASPSARTRATLRIVARRAGCIAPVAYEQGLYGAEAESYLSILRALDPAISFPFLVGHNPAIEHLVAILTGGAVRLPTGSVLLLGPGTELEPLESWSELGPRTCTLEWLLRPRILRVLR